MSVLLNALSVFSLCCALLLFLCFPLVFALVLSVVSSFILVFVSLFCLVCVRLGLVRGRVMVLSRLSLALTHRRMLRVSSALGFQTSCHPMLPLSFLASLWLGRLGAGVVAMVVPWIFARVLAYLSLASPKC